MANFKGETGRMSHADRGSVVWNRHAMAVRDGVPTGAGACGPSAGSCSVGIVNVVPKPETHTLSLAGSRAVGLLVLRRKVYFLDMRRFRSAEEEAQHDQQHDGGHAQQPTNENLPMSISPRVGLPNRRCTVAIAVPAKLACCSHCFWVMTLQLNFNCSYLSGDGPTALTGIATMSRHMARTYPRSRHWH